MTGVQTCALPISLDLFGRRFIPFKAFQEKRDAWYEMHWSGYDKVMEVPSLSGCFMFIRTDVLKQIGGFDKRFFMYAEDLDLCRRVGEVTRTMYYPEVSVFHEYEKGSYKNRKLLKYHICSVIKRSEERRVGKECRIGCRSRWSPYH